MKQTGDILNLVSIAVIMTSIIYVTREISSFEIAVIISLGYIEALIIFNYAKRPPRD